MAVNADRRFWRNFFALYRTYPELWDPRSPRYNIREYKDRAYEALVVKMREIDPNATVEIVKRKLNIYKSNYKRELKRKKSTGTKSSLWYFDDLSFLLENERNYPTNSESSADLNISDLVNLQVQSELESTNFNDDNILVKSEIDESFFNDGNSSNNEQSNVSINQDFNTFHPSEDDAEKFGKSWAAVFRKIPSNQQILAKKLIDDILFEGCMGRLKEKFPQIT